MKNTNKALLIWTAMALAVSLGCSEDGGGADAGSGGFGDNDELISETGGATGLDGFSPSGAAGASGEDGTGGSTGTPTTSGGEIREGICYPPEPAPTRDDLGDAVEVLDSSGDMITGPATYPGGVIYDVEGEGLYNIPAGSSTPELIVATQGRRYYPWIMGD